MPGRDIRGLMEDPAPEFALFKSHKALPRSNTQKNERRVTYPTVQKGDQLQAAATLSVKSSERIRSWVQEPMSTHVALDHDLPLTPPIICLDHEDGNWMDDPTLASYLSVANKINYENEPTTPLVQRSPPTPETTPPRATHDLVHSPVPRDPSVRTSSFETAREHPSSDGEATPVDSSSRYPAREKWWKTSGKEGLKSIGLGLGLESDDDEKATSAGITPRNSTQINNWKSVSELHHGARAEDQSNGAVVEDRRPGGSCPQHKMIRTRPQKSSQPRPRSEKIGEEADSPIPRSQSLRQRIERAQYNPSPSMEKFTEEIDWPRKEELDLDAKLREVDNRRFSQVSSTSTVVEAMVIDSKPRRRQTLRHTGKVSDFKSESPRVSPSNSSSIISDNISRRRLPRNSWSPDRGRRRSVATDVSGNAALTLATAQQGAIPVKTTLRRLIALLFQKLTSLQQRPRPTTAPHETFGYFDIPHREHRAVSAAAAQFMSKPGKRARREDTANNSQAIVLATQVNDEPLESRAAPSTFGVPLAGQPQAVLHLSDPPDPHGVNLDRARSGEWSAFRPRSALVTPFSLRSAHSSTPGTLEVNEATAISIYPHTNKSILVIQEMAGSDSPETSAIIAGNANIALPVPVPPAEIEHWPQRLDSPLQNPRDPPKPPDLKLIPPTPANGTLTPETDLQPSQPNTKNRFSGTISVVKRALSTHRHSDSSTFPRQPLARNNTVPSRHRPSVGNAQENNLHPFWRPRGFWDDFSDDSDSDSEFGNSGVLFENFQHGSPRQQQQRSLSLGQSASRHHSRPPSLSRRLTDSLGFNKNGKHHTHSWTEHNRPSGNTNSLSAGSPNRMRETRPEDSNPVARNGNKVQFVGFKSLAQRMEKAMNQREEGKREKVRERLRGSIDVIRGDAVGGHGNF